jgi:hypothetical protein
MLFLRGISVNKGFLAAALAVVFPVFSLCTTAVAAGPVEPRTDRGALVHRIVMKWGGHVQESYRRDVRAWAMDMVPVFSRASLDQLSRAAAAGDFDGMNDALLGDNGYRSDAPGARALATADAGKVLGDEAADLVYVPVTPCRIIDTRVAGGVIAANTTRGFDVTSVGTYAPQGGAANDCAIGGAGSFAAAVINFTVVTPSAGGYITAFPFGATQPVAATVNYTAGDIRGNLAIVRLDQGPAGNEMSVYTFAQTHLVADVVGYFITPQATNLNCVATAVSTFNISGNSANFFNNPTCPTGYTATTPYCWTATSGVYSQGGGYNANAVGSATFCAWQNTNATAQQVFGGNMCCRVPGR